MPPSTCTQSFAVSKNASTASAAADATAERVRVSVVDGARRVPHRGAGELGAGEHVGAAVLHALELPDRATELPPLLRVLARSCRRTTATRRPRRPRRAPRRGRAPSRRATAGEHATGAGTVASTVTSATRRVRSTVGRSVRVELAARSTTHPSATGATSRSARWPESTGSSVPLHAGARRRPARLGVSAPVERDGADQATAARPGPRVAAATAAPASTARCSTAAAEHVGEERPGAQRAAELLEHHHELGEPVRPRRRAPRRRASPSQPCATSVGPERRERLGFSSSVRPRHRRRAVALDPAPDGRGAAPGARQ